MTASHIARKEKTRMNDDIKLDDLALAITADDMGPPVNPEAANDLLPVIGAPARKRARKVVTTLNLTSRTCKWPIGDPTQTNFHYCGQLPQTGRPYCTAHDDMSYQPQRKRSAPPARSL